MTIAKPFVAGWSEAELAWLAGLYEGEGCLSQQRSTRHRYWVLAITMTDADVVARAQEIAGSGSFIGPMQCPSLAAYKPTFRWTVNAQQHIYAITEALLPYLGDRRKAKVMEFREDYERRFAPSPFYRCGRHVKEDGRPHCRLCTNERARARRLAA